MESYSDKVLSTISERTSNGFRITVESEVTDIDFSSMRDPMAIGIAITRPNESRPPLAKRTKISSLDLCVNDGRLEMTRGVYGGSKLGIVFSDLISYSETFFQDGKVNEELQEFLREQFPNDFERTKTFKNLMKAWDSRGDEAIPMDDFFGTSAQSVENYAEALLMTLAYGFPVLFNRLPWDITSEAMYEVASDMTLSYCDFMNASTEPEMADMAFGTRRKFFRKLTPSLSVNELSLINQLSGIVSADVLEWALRGVDFTGSRPMVDCWYGNAEVLAKFSPTVQRYLIRDLFVNDTHAHDAFDMVKRYATRYSYFRGVKTIEQLHDKAMNMIPEITEDSRIEKVDHSVRSNQEVFIPQVSSKVELLVNHKEFIRIGKELNICIGSASYFEKALTGESYCYKILKDGALIGAIEVKRNKKGEWTSVQCRGEKNRRLETEAVIVEGLVNRLEETPATLDFAGASLW